MIGKYTFLDTPQKLEITSIGEGNIDEDKIYIEGYNVHGKKLSGTLREVNEMISKLNNTVQEISE